MRRLLIAAPLIALAMTPAGAPSARAGEGERTALILTLYGQGTALVEEHRPVAFADGATTLRFDGVSGSMFPASARVAPLNDAPGAVREMAFNGEVATQATLLKAFEGKEVSLLRPTADGQGRERVRARVLRAGGEPLLEVEGRLVAGIPWMLEFDALPPGLALLPSLTAELAGTRKGNGAIALRYLTAGLGWSADHVIELAPDEKGLSLTTLATVSNRTGTDLPGAEMALVSGEINMPAPRYQGEMVPPPMPMAAPAMTKSAAMDMPEQESLAGYHVYHMPGRVSLDNGQTKQLSLLAAPAIAAEVLLESEEALAIRPTRRGGEGPESHPIRRLTFTNTEAAKLGAPVPAGVARVYQRDSKGRVRFLGQDHLSALPVGAKAELTLGEDFDVTVKRVQTEYKKLSDSMHATAHRITVRNGKPTPVSVRLVEGLSGDWEITEESARHEALDSSRVRWTVTVPAKGETTVTYRLRSEF